MAESKLEWLKMARIDIKNHGEGNDLKVMVTEGEKCKVYQPKWFSKAGNGYVLVTYDQHLVMELECQGAGTLRLRLQGIDRRGIDGTRLPLWVDYSRLAINKEVIFWELKPQWHDRPYVYTRKVTDGEKIEVEISWALHGYKGEELANLISLWRAK